MLFSSLSFLFIFLPIVLFLYYISDNKFKNTILLLSSLFFYGYGGFKFLLLMIFSIFINYSFGILVDKYRDNKLYVKCILVISSLSNLVILIYYKYMNFFIENINSLFKSDINITKIIMPIGISFYTFQGLSYVIDVYRKNGKVQKNPLNVALYISLFPQLIAGPIVRYETVDGQISNRSVDLDKFILGIKRFILGLAKKVLIANTFARIADDIFALKLENINSGVAWIGILAYTIQIYFDFSGYSDMAIGLGKMFGFDFLENFNYPYISKSITEFWRRWHMSLGTWFRDYVYIPLGGNRVTVLRHIINTLIVWLLTGIWHGASWNFIVWGVYFGVIILLEKYAYGKYIEKLPIVIQHSYALILIVVGWVFFRSDDLNNALKYINIMFSFQFDKVTVNQTMRYVSEYRYEWIIAALASTPIYRFVACKFDSIKNNKMKYIKYILNASYLITFFIISIIYLVASTYNPFIYFRF
jgi:alginate O-acetyltransferase complex protein AlgI